MKDVYNRFMDRLHEDGNFIPPKIQLTLLISSLGWFVWATTAIFTLQPNEPRYTQAHADAAYARHTREMERAINDLYQRIDARLDLIPTSSTRMNKIESRLTEIAAAQHELAKKIESLMP